MSRYVAAIDQGTTSTRCILFDHSGGPISVAQREHRQSYPRAGWVEHDPEEIWARAQQVFAEALGRARARPGDIVALGVTNQRETVLLWDRRTGKPLHPAIVWQDTRTAAACGSLAGEAGPDRFRHKTGLPIASYFSGPKLQWLLDSIPAARARAERGELLAGTIDSWLIWNLTGGPAGGRHVTDISNASRTLLMNLATLDWDEELLLAMDVPRGLLAEIRPSNEVYGPSVGAFAGIPIASDLGDQQAALFGQTCFQRGMAKNTYGTGCFLLLNTGEEMRPSQHGLLTTAAWQLVGSHPVYALEGSVAIAGALVQWLRDQLGLIGSAAEIETLAGSVDDNGGVVIVPAFSGLFAPYWRSDARGAIFGLTAYAGKGHLARAALEATAFQTHDVLEAMRGDTGIELTELRVDGGMVVNEILMQFQADILNVPVVRPAVTETTALGAAYAAGLAVGFWSGLDELDALWQRDRHWLPRMKAEVRGALCANWRKAVTGTFGWSPD
ncbi:glycerol kinase [Methylolobus aquaticus]|nr:glycerol kinase [Methylolobus aquaticus]